MDTGLDTALHPGRSRADVAYSWIKRQLLAGNFPLPARLGEERLAGELQVSRTPVREALSRLHTEGLLDRHPDGGYTPAVPDLDEIVELYEVRAVLERGALGRGGHDRAMLTALRHDWQSLLDELDSIQADPDFVLVDEDFHVRLAQAAGNRSLASSLATINERIRIVRMHDFLTTPRIEATVDQHLGILDRVLDGDLAGAQLALIAHLDESAHVVQERAATAIARMLTARRDLR